jgi:hypothetical protein
MTLEAALATSRWQHYPHRIMVKSMKLDKHRKAGGKNYSPPASEYPIN